MKLNNSAASVIVVFIAVLVALFSKLNVLYLFFGIIGGMIFFILKDRSEKNRAFLVIMLVIVIAARLVLSLGVSFTKKGEVSQDEGLYSKKALLMSFYFKGEKKLEKYFGEYFDDYDMTTGDGYGINVYTYILSGLYYCFGYQTYGARLVNILFFLISFIFLFYLSRSLFGEGTAKVTAVIYAFWPSIMMWSVSIGTDMMVIMSVINYLYCLNKFRERGGMFLVVLMVLFLGVIFSIKRPIVELLLVVSIIIFLRDLAGKLSVKGKSLIVTVVITGIILLSPFAGKIYKRIDDKVLSIIKQQKCYAVTDDAGYLIYPASCYVERTWALPDILKGYFKGMGYAIFSPFPWDISSKGQFAAYFQIIILYILFPFSIFGIISGIIKNMRYVSPVFLYVFFTLSILALVEGNIGAVFRHRDLVSPFLIMFSGCGIVSLFSFYNRNKTV